MCDKYYKNAKRKEQDFINKKEILLRSTCSEHRAEPFNHKHFKASEFKNSTALN